MLKLFRYVDNHLLSLLRFSRLFWMVLTISSRWLLLKICTEYAVRSKNAEVLVSFALLFIFDFQDLIRSNISKITITRRYTSSPMKSLILTSGTFCFPTFTWITLQFWFWWRNCRSGTRRSFRSICQRTCSGRRMEVPVVSLTFLFSLFSPYLTLLSLIYSSPVPSPFLRSYSLFLWILIPLLLGLVRCEATRSLRYNRIT